MFNKALLRSNRAHELSRNFERLINECAKHNDRRTLHQIIALLRNSSEKAQFQADLIFLRNEQRLYLEGGERL